MFLGFLWYLPRFGTGTFRQYGFAWHWVWKALIRMFRFHFGCIFLELELNAADSKVFATLWSLNVSFSMVGLKLISGSFRVY
jgi:hypothetical protein